MTTSTFRFRPTRLVLTVLFAMVLAASLVGPQQPADAAPFSCAVRSATGGAVVVSWPDIRAKGYDVIEDGGSKVWVTTTRRKDYSPGSTYKIVAFGNGTNWTTATCSNPGAGGGSTFSCTVKSATGGAVVVSWPDIGANGYDVIEDGGSKVWVTTTRRKDYSPGSTYRIVAFGNGTNWTTATCSNPNRVVSRSVTLLAAGDIGLCGRNSAAQVGAYVTGQRSSYFMALGDLAYPNGSDRDFANCYNPWFGQVKGRTLPVIGNHEYVTARASGYSNYFGSSAGQPGRFFYSRDLGNWHIISLNSQCWSGGGCGKSSPQYQWLKSDLEANKKACILVAWHHAYRTSGQPEDATWMRDFYQLADSYGADILLNGHAHDYERFQPMTASGRVSSSGIRSFVVGTGGADLRSFTRIESGSVTRTNRSWGVLRLELGDGSYRWNFVKVAGSGYSDSGTGTC